MNMMERKRAGSARETSSPMVLGPRIYNLFPLIAGQVSSWVAELPRIARMGFDWVYVNPFHEAGASGSLYAVKGARTTMPRSAASCRRRRRSGCGS